MEIVTAIVAWIALVLAGFAMLTGLMLVNELIKKNSENHINTETPSDGYSEDFKTGWSRSSSFMMSMINITMFDLYRTQDVLDYDTNTQEFISRLNRIIEDESYRSEAIKQYEEYMEGREE